MDESNAVPELPSPRARLCWKQSAGMVYCDRRARHHGPHSWELDALKTTATTVQGLVAGLDRTGGVDFKKDSAAWIALLNAVNRSRP